MESQRLSCHFNINQQTTKKSSEKNCTFHKLPDYAEEGAPDDRAPRAQLLARLPLSEGEGADEEADDDHDDHEADSESFEAAQPLGSILGNGSPRLVARICATGTLLGCWSSSLKYSMLGVIVII